MGAQVHYPATQERARDAPPFPWFRREVIEALAVQNIPGVTSLLKATLSNCSQLNPSLEPLPSNEQAWPVIMFSSGLFGSCEMYSQFCRELASFGAIVIAIEHEDGSSIFATHAASGDTIPYVKPRPDEALPMRSNQADQHASEICVAASTIMRVISAGAAPDDDFSGGRASLLPRVLKCGAADRMLLIGHSFGSTSCIRYLRRVHSEAQPCPFQGVLLMDLWDEPLAQKDRNHGLQIPCVCMFSQAWFDDAHAISRTFKIMKLADKRWLGAVWVLGTKHQWISETSYFAPHWLLRKFGILGPASFHRAHEATIRTAWLALEAFLDAKKQSGLQESMLEVDASIIRAARPSDVNSSAL